MLKGTTVLYLKGQLCYAKRDNCVMLKRITVLCLKGQQLCYAKRDNCVMLKGTTVLC